MKMHVSHAIRPETIYRAAQFASNRSGTGHVVVVQCDRSGSRTHDHAFNVKLEGDGSVSRHRPNGGSYGAGDGYAAHWDAWGWFLAFLFDIDPSMKTPYDASHAAFTVRTANRFALSDWVATK